MIGQLRSKEVQEKRQTMAQQVYTITRKAVNWGEENGYSALIRDIDKFMKAYRSAMQELERQKAAENTNWYERQTPEELQRLLEKRKASLEKIETALLSKM